MTHAIRIHATGGPEALQLDDVSLPTPGPGEALVRHAAIGVNFIDTYHRSGLYPLPLPSGIGSEAAGVVEAVGPGVTDVAVGQRVAYCGGSPGSYAEARVMAAERRVAPQGAGAELYLTRLHVSTQGGNFFSGQVHCLID